MKYLGDPQSGSASATTASRNRSGQYYRTRAIPVQPRTAKQVQVRSNLSTLSASWRGLTSAQMAGWTAFGNSFSTVNSLGTSIHLTGLQAYVKVNMVNLQNGDAVVAVPPALPVFVAPSVTGADADAATPIIEVAGAAAAAGTKNMIFASPQVSPGVSFNGNYRFLTSTLVFAAGKAPILVPYTAAFGALVSGKKIFVKVVQSQAGMQDNGTVYTLIVV